MRRQIDAGLLKRLRDELDKHSIKKEWVTYECKLVTPMYGGGVNGGQVDKEMPIRASAIRGQLRFWWRIACGPKDPKVMREKEEAIWGGIGEKKPKQVEWKLGLSMLISMVKYLLLNTKDIVKIQVNTIACLNQTLNLVMLMRFFLHKES